MSAIDNLKQEISDLENKREELYVNFRDIEEQLKRKKLLLNAFGLVSSDLDLYHKWLDTALATPPPPTPEPVTPEPVTP